jgi:hypothetical protein
MIERVKRPTGPGEETAEWRDADGNVIRETRTIKPNGEVALKRETAHE